MTSTMLAPTPQPSTDPTLAQAAGPPPKKKRKRAGTGGASDDCFTCSTRGAVCDRKRPYCTQCIEIGKECSGYKTTLTWGVGVASRGKLRGLACPIANKNADGSDVTPVEMEARRRRKSSTAQYKKDRGGKISTARAAPDAIKQEPHPTASFGEGLQSSQTFANANGSGGPQHSLVNWQGFKTEESIWRRRTEDVRHQSINLPPLHSIQTGLHASIDAMKSARSMSSYSDTPFYSPVDYTNTPSSMQFPEPLMHSMSAPYPNSASTLSVTDGNSMGASSLAVYPEVIEAPPNTIHSQSANTSSEMDLGSSVLEPMPGAFYDGSEQILTPISSITYSHSGGEIFGDGGDFEDTEERESSLVDARFSNPFFQVSSRLRTLINYYDRNICPYLVTFDNTDNPYRKHILQFALQNEGLQHAIAALATNNYRMRTKELRQIGHVEELGDAFGSAYINESSGPTSEESCYKQMSINHLNMRLIDSGSAQDDSVLATLLILCLFHVCDSGFSKFKTQLAGVQKLLSLRHPSTQSDFTRWVEMFFTWFDVMTSTVNDREVQIKGNSLAMLDYNVDLGAMEHFSGCDGRLFKLIARLGRLNLLAQGRPVRGSSTQPPSWRKRTAAARMTSLNPSDYDNIDGNGWGTPIVPSSPDAEGSPDPDDRQDFWTEWHDTRTRLEAWQAHTPTPVATNSPLDQQDLYHINESFRLAALLYTERLGSPLLPSSASPFQRLVTQALTHISALRVTSCVNKFLLWPLFIIGTESVDEAHREIIRGRCKAVAEESGFYNNMSSLYVLERVWSEVGCNVRGMEAAEVKARRRDSEVSTRPGRYGQAFRWRKAMDRVNGEYIVI